VSDHDLTADEEKTLEHIRDALNISPEELTEELAFLDELRHLRAIREGRLVPVPISVKLQANEECYLEAEARLLKEKVIRSFQSEGRGCPAGC
jgi:hypothetical protein